MSLLSDPVLLLSPSVPLPPFLEKQFTDYLQVLQALPCFHVCPVGLGV